MLTPSCQKELPDALKNVEVSKGDKTPSPSPTPSPTPTPTPTPELKVSEPGQFGAKGGVQTITITATEAWTLSKSEGSDWLVVKKTSGTAGTTQVDVEAKENTDTKARTATISVKSEAGSQTVNVIQSGAEPVLQLNKNDLSFTANAGSDSFTITSNTDWTITSSQAWCTFSSSSGSGNATVTVRVSKNTSTDSRTATVTVEAGDLSHTIAVTQSGTDPAPSSWPLYIFFIGATDGWANVEQKLALTDEGAGIYTGYVYCADPNGWGNCFKFQKVAGDWGTEINTGHMTGGMTGGVGLHDGDTNFEIKDGEGVYFFTLNLSANTLNALKVEKMGIIGDFNGWGGDVEMKWNATDYCFEATGAGVTANGWKFRVNADWGINLGSNDSAEPSKVLADLVANGKNIGVAGNTVKLYPTRKTSDKIYCTVE